MQNSNRIADGYGCIHSSGTQSFFPNSITSPQGWQCVWNNYLWPLVRDDYTVFIVQRGQTTILRKNT